MSTPSSLNNSSPFSSQCPRCGELNSAKALACSVCGNRLASNSSQNTTPSATAQQTTLAPVPSTTQPVNTYPVNTNIESNIATGVKWFSVGSNAYSLIWYSVFCLIIGVVLLIFAPWQVTVPVMLVLGVIFLLQVLTIKRVSAVEMDPAKRLVARGIESQVVVGTDETILSMATGIEHTGWRSESLGVCEIKYPHNAVIVTDKNLFLLFVPLPGADVTVEGTDMGRYYFTFGKKKIEAKLQEMLSTMSLEQIVNSDQRNMVFPRTDLQPLKTPWEFGFLKCTTLKFAAKSGEKHAYFFRDRNELMNIVRTMQS
jgi:hypothetical protein